MTRNSGAKFDYCDPRSTFATSVSQRAVTSPALLSAILATTARHLGLIGRNYSHIAEHYHRKCIELLIPALDDTSAALDEGLYAATVILRLFEEISGSLPRWSSLVSHNALMLIALTVPMVGQDTESHLLGAQTFARAQAQTPLELSGIQTAVFRVLLRQEIVNAFITQRPVQLSQEYHSSADLFWGSAVADDSTFAFRMILLCAEVLTYCYGETPNTRDAWEDINARLDLWMTTKPMSFEPLLYRPNGRPGQPFPQVRYLNDCHGKPPDQKTPGLDLTVWMLTKTWLNSGCTPTLSRVPDITRCPRSRSTPPWPTAQTSSGRN